MRQVDPERPRDEEIFDKTEATVLHICVCLESYSTDWNEVPLCLVIQVFKKQRKQLSWGAQGYLLPREYLRIKLKQEGLAEFLKNIFGELQQHLGAVRAQPNKAKVLTAENQCTRRGRG